MVGFQLCGKLKEPKFRFDHEEVRYSHRFAPFAAIVTPPMVHYAQYKVSAHACFSVHLIIIGTMT